jgi:hypothetical protein
MALYSACPLQQPDSVRIVLLHPAAHPRKDIHCDLLSISLSSISEDQTLSYTTLSYVWGDTKKAKSIFMSGERLDIGANLYSALQNLRRQDRPIRLWVDALSINQNDPDERSQQVQQMRKVYANAFETVIYLGPDDGSKTCRSAWDFLELRSSWAMNDQRDRDKTLPKTREKTVSLRTGYNDVLKSVMSRDWFSRVWVIQEMVVSEQLSIQCGARRIPLDDFCRTLFLYFNPLHTKDGFLSQTGPYSKALGSLHALTSKSNAQITEIRPGFEVLSRENPDWKDIIQPFREMCQTRLLYQRAHRDLDMAIPKWVLNDSLAHFVEDDTEFRHGSLRLAHLLSKSRKFQATDPRDKTFALLGISAPLGSTDIQSLVDYNKPVHQTYREMAHFILEAETTFDILSQAGHTSVVDDLNFSSWAGKWSEREFPPTSVLSRLGGESEDRLKMRRQTVSKHHTWSEDGAILGCTGGIMGELVAVSKSGIPKSKTSLDDEDAEWLLRWQEFFPLAMSVIQESRFSIVEQSNPNVGFTKIITARTGCNTRVEVTSNSEHGADTAPLKESIFIAGGIGFIADVFALREGRKLGIVRSIPGKGHTDKDAAYSWGVVPETAKVGDWVATITGKSNSQLTSFPFQDVPRVRGGPQPSSKIHLLLLFLSS